MIGDPIDDPIHDPARDPIHDTFRCGLHFVDAALFTSLKIILGQLRNH